MATLTEWANFYVIIGSSAGALIGLQFVVITLIADMPVEQADAQASGAFTTPSVVHFAMALFLSAIVSAPWSTLIPVAIIWGLLGFIGIVYSVIVIRRFGTQIVYTPVFEDWLFHALLPMAAYGMLAGSGCLVPSHPEIALFLVAAASLLLLFVGIHNAWDTVIYHTFVRRARGQQKEEGSKESKS
ncbi:MAG TPA: hypothetical protein VME24_02470 [Alphaproteobacteria bacterium]|nr:hypothetical protein [Alphaproteobacteria bacterium]